MASSCITYCTTVRAPETVGKGAQVSRRLIGNEYPYKALTGAFPQQTALLVCCRATNIEGTNSQGDDNLRISRCISPAVCNSHGWKAILTTGRVSKEWRQCSNDGRTGGCGRERESITGHS